MDNVIHMYKVPGEGWYVEISRANVVLAKLGPFKRKPSSGQIRIWQFRWLDGQQARVIEEG